MPDDAQTDRIGVAGPKTHRMDVAHNVHALFGVNGQADTDAVAATSCTARAPKAAARSGDGNGGPEAGWGRVLIFPNPAPSRFSPGMRLELLQLAAGSPSLQPLSFDVDARGTERCHLGACMTISWARPYGMVLTDTFSGYVDHGPFDTLSDICLVIADLDF